MGLSCAALLGLLGWFKYYGFVSVNFDNLTHVLGLGRAVPLLQVALPIAISFYTFMALSYVIDIYRRQLEPARPLDLALYLSFFPHLLAGPIVRGNELLPQLRRRRDSDAVDYSRAPVADPGRPVQEGGHLLLRLECHRATGVHGAVAALGARGHLRRVGLRRADLLRLQRVHRHRHRARPAARDPVPGQLQRALHGAQPAGVLATLAHDPLPLATRLPLHTAGWQQRIGGTDGPQHHDHHGAGRPVARRGVDLRVLGGAARRRSVRGARAPPVPGAARAARRCSTVRCGSGCSGS